MSKILVIGDVIEDVIVIPESEIRPNTDTNSAIHKSMGGQAANVASWLAFFGIQTRFVGCVGLTDVRKLEAELDQIGIEAALQSSAKPTGSLVVLVQGASRSMLTDRGANLGLNLRSIDPTGFAAVYLSGYSLFGRALGEIKDFAARVKQAGALLAIDPGSYGYIKDHGLEEFKDLISEADLIFPNLEEDQLLGLSGAVALSVVTKGQNGAEAHWASGQSIEIAGLATESIDPTGAGDAFCAGFLASLVANERFQDLRPEIVQKALKSGVEAGSKAVSLVGARPSFNSGV
ncbi:RbsK Sugar kinases, ribokinase family [Microbacteriaceae bacterium]